MQKKTFFKWTLITLASLLVALVAFVLFALLLFDKTSERADQANGGDYAENVRRSCLAISLKKDAGTYYKKNKIYPQLAELYPLPDKLLIDYLKAGIISYTAKKNSFCVRYIDSDHRFQKPDQKYSMSWNGMQYCSRKEDLLGFSESWHADGNGFYIYDLH